MQLNQLNYFSEVVVTGSISKAAKKLHISQPSLSATIKKMEEELKQPLFKRVKYGVIPTEFGNRVYADYMDFKKKMDSWYPKEMMETEICLGSINFNVMPSSSQFFYEKIIFPFNEAYPAIKFYLKNAFLQTIFEDLENSKSNIAVLSVPKKYEETFLHNIGQKNWHSEKIYTDQRVLAISSQHPLAKKERLEVENLKQLSLVYYALENDTISTNYERFFKNSYRVGSYSDIMMFMLHGKAVFLPLRKLAYLDEYVKAEQLKFFPIPINSIPNEVPIYLIYTDAITDCEAFFIKYLLDYFANLTLPVDESRDLTTL